MGLPSFITQMGATELVALMTGISIGWGLCVKIRLGPLKDAANKIELRYDELIAKIQAEFWQQR